MRKALPTHAGQIAAIWVSEDYVPKEHYIVCTVPNPDDIHQKIKVCSITELQRATVYRREPECELIPLYNLYFVAKDLITWVESWNIPNNIPGVTA